MATVRQFAGVLFIHALGIMRASVNFEDDTVAIFRIAVLCLGFLIAACGQTGPLVLPEKNDAPANASAQSK
ncbi:MULTISPECIES: LPS translocon maturation chaperone LptM [Zhongshania]|uniref:Putative small lipoprotein YifL n=1 Tax=Zhongshania antarctica TaxID=641702 RepID=A0A840R581_9GAMM|nr:MULTISPECIES: lipoprotein [Zhongshania]MBB5187738.1 putative small lipoprotein YifL [Zhongshania antarctica]